MIYYILIKKDTKLAEMYKLKEAILSETERPFQEMVESLNISFNLWIAWLHKIISKHQIALIALMRQ